MSELNTVCESCKHEFVLNPVDIQEVKTEANGHGIMLSYFVCPKCDKVYRVCVKDDTYYKLENEFMVARKNAERKTKPVNPVVKEMQIRTIQNKFDRLKAHEKRLSAQLAGEFVLSNDKIIYREKHG